MAPLLQWLVRMSTERLRQVSDELRQRSERPVQRSRRAREAGAVLTRDQHQLLEDREVIETWEPALAVSFPVVRR